MMSFSVISSFIIFAPHLSYFFALVTFSKTHWDPQQKAWQRGEIPPEKFIGRLFFWSHPTSTGQLDSLVLEIRTYLAVENAAAKRVTWKIRERCWKPLTTQATNSVPNICTSRNLAD